MTTEEAARKIAKRLNKEFIQYDDDIAEKVLQNPEKYFVYIDLRLTELEPSDLSGMKRNV